MVRWGAWNRSKLEKENSSHNLGEEPQDTGDSAPAGNAPQNDTGESSYSLCVSSAPVSNAHRGEAPGAGADHVAAEDNGEADQPNDEFVYPGGSASASSSSTAVPAIPTPAAVLFADPRVPPSSEDEENWMVGVVGFYYRLRWEGRYDEEDWDALCTSGFLGNSWDVGADGFLLESRGRSARFRSADAAFTALQYSWDVAGEFSNLIGDDIDKMAEQLLDDADPFFGGFGTPWKAMLAVLRAKFAPGTLLAEALLQTCDAFLLHHSPMSADEPGSALAMWSDNCIGDGMNWLGLQLMIIRDELAGENMWTEFLGRYYDAVTGKEQEDGWQQIVGEASVALVDAVTEMLRANSKERLREAAGVYDENEPALDQLALPPGPALQGDELVPWSGERPKSPGLNLPLPDRLSTEQNPEAEADDDASPLRRKDKRIVTYAFDHAHSDGQQDYDNDNSARGAEHGTSSSGVRFAPSIENRPSSAGSHAKSGNMAIEPSYAHMMTQITQADDSRGFSDMRDTTYSTYTDPPALGDETPAGKGMTVRFQKTAERDSVQTFDSDDPWDDEYEEIEDVDINKPGIIPLLSFSSAWVGVSAGLILSIVWFYQYEEIPKHEELATVVAVDNARAHAAEVLAPAVSIVAAASVAFETLAIASLSDYEAILRVLAPHFKARPAVSEVYISSRPEEYIGSVHVTVATGNDGIVLRTDRPDCGLVDGQRGCAIDPLDANLTEWYINGYGVGKEWWFRPPSAAWEGPVFMRRRQEEVVCEDLCWHPTYAYIGRIGGTPYSNGTDLAQVQQLAANNGTVNESNISNASMLSSEGVILVRAAMDASALQDVAVKAEELSRGQAFLTTRTGDIVAASDMADAIFIEHMDGYIRPRKIWEVDQSWANGTDATWIRKARDKFTFVLDGYRVSAWPLTGPTIPTRALGQELRIVLAVREDAFYDAFLGPMLGFQVGVGATPACLLVLFTLIAAYVKFCLGGGRRSQISEPPG